MQSDTSGNVGLLNLAQSAGQASSRQEPCRCPQLMDAIANLPTLQISVLTHSPSMSPALRSRTAPHSVKEIPVVIVGGGVCGLLAADRCLREGIKFLLFERGEDYGGNWSVRANSYSHLQVSR